MPPPRDGSDIYSPENLAPADRLLIKQSLKKQRNLQVRIEAKGREVPFHNVPVAFWCVYEHITLPPR